MLVATATHVTMVGPLLACNPKGGWDDEDTFLGDEYSTETWGTDTDDGTDDDGDDEGDGDGDVIDPCPPVPSWGNIIEVGPEEAAMLPMIVAEADTGTTIALLPGLYDLSGGEPLRLSKPGMSLRSVLDDRDTVILEGGHQLDEIVVLEAAYTTVAHVTLQSAGSHAIRVHGSAEEDITHVLIHDVAIRNPGSQAISIDRSDAGHFADHGAIRCSELELDDDGRAMLETCDIAGIDARGARGWDVHDNHLIGWWCDDGLAQPAIHFWQSSRDTVVQRNVIEDSARGIGFGYGEVGTGDERIYADQPCPDTNVPGHIDGIIRNNTIWMARPELFASPDGAHSGISLERACAAQVYHNTVVALDRPLVSIAYWWPDTQAIIMNNLVTHGILPFAGAQAELAGNIADASLAEFIDAMVGDLHLSASAVAVDAGVLLNPGLANDDIDAELRVGPRDVGADERED